MSYLLWYPKYLARNLNVLMSHLGDLLNVDSHSVELGEA